MLSKFSQTTVTTGSLNSQDMIKVLKQSGHDFSGKPLCDGHCTEILCDVYVEINIQQMVIRFYQKASLRICYIILIDCKDP